MLKATVSGSFHRHMAPIYEAVGSLREAGVNVLSPSDPRVVDNIGDFLFVASDKLRSIKLVQDRHLQAIWASDFLWVVCPDGYTGASTSMEIGAAWTCGTPVFSDSLAVDSTLGRYVTHVPSMLDAIQAAKGRSRRPNAIPHILVDPNSAVENIHAAADRVLPYLLKATGNGRGEAERETSKAAHILRRSIAGIN